MLVFLVGRGENPLIPKLSERRRSEQVSGFQNQAQPSMCNDCAHEKNYTGSVCMPVCLSKCGIVLQGWTIGDVQKLLAGEARSDL